MIKQYIRKSKQLYTTKNMRHQWIRKTIHLMSTGRHRLLNDGWKNGGTNNA